MVSPVQFTCHSLSVASHSSFSSVLSKITIINGTGAHPTCQILYYASHQCSFYVSICLSLSLSLSCRRVCLIVTNTAPFLVNSLCYCVCVCCNVRYPRTYYISFLSSDPWFSPSSSIHVFFSSVQMLSVASFPFRFTPAKLLSGIVAPIAPL